MEDEVVQNFPSWTRGVDPDRAKRVSGDGVVDCRKTSPVILSEAKELSLSAAKDLPHLISSLITTEAATAPKTAGK